MPTMMQFQAVRESERSVRLTGFALVVAAIAAILSAPWRAAAEEPKPIAVGVKVYPKWEAILRTENGDYPAQYGLGSLRVQEIKEDSLLVGKQVKGWIERSEVMTKLDAIAYYSQMIKTWRKIVEVLPQPAPLDQETAESRRKLLWAYRYRGGIYAKNKEPDKAIADYSELIRLEPENAYYYMIRGNVFNKKQEYEKGIADLIESVRLDPSSAVGYNALAWMMAVCPNEEYRDGKEAVGFAKKACELTGWNGWNSIDTLAVAYAETGDFDSAILYQNQSIELNKNDPKFVKAATERVLLFKDHKPYHKSLDANASDDE